MLLTIISSILCSLTPLLWFFSIKFSLLWNYKKLCRYNSTQGVCHTGKSSFWGTFKPLSIYATTFQHCSLGWIHLRRKYVALWWALITPGTFLAIGLDWGLGHLVCNLELRCRNNRWRGQSEESHPPEVITSQLCSHFEDIWWMVSIFWAHSLLSS